MVLAVVLFLLSKDVVEFVRNILHRIIDGIGDFFGDIFDRFLSFFDSVIDHGLNIFSDISKLFGDTTHDAVKIEITDRVDTQVAQRRKT